MFEQPRSRARSPFVRLAFTAVILTAGAAPALAHGGGSLTNETAFSTWRLTPDIVVPTLLAIAIYVRGMMRRSAIASPVPWWRHLFFFAGVSALFMALQSPVDPLAERLFFVHQIQHLLLRMIGPLLIALSSPQGMLTAGLPRSLRQNALAPIVRNKWVRGLFGFIGGPVVVTTLFIAALYVWEVPKLHNAALLNDTIHYAMHVTMLLAGLMFWWRVLEHRAPPQGIRFGIRLMMLWFAILSNILLGSYTTFKTAVLYDAYDVAGRLFGYRAIVDEQIGGVIIWIPNSMMCLVAILIVIHRFGLHETRTEDRRTASPGSDPAGSFGRSTGGASLAQTRPTNHRMALAFAFFALCVFGTAISVGLLSSLARM